MWILVIQMVSQSFKNSKRLKDGKIYTEVFQFFVGWSAKHLNQDLLEIYRSSTHWRLVLA